MKTPKNCILRARVPRHYKEAARLAAEQMHLDESDILRIAFFEWCKRRRLLCA